MTSLPPEAAYPMEAFEWWLPVPHIWMSLPSEWLDIYRFPNWSFSYLRQVRHFTNLDQFPICSHFSNYKHVTINQSFILWAGYGRFTEYGQDFRPQKTIWSLSVWQQIQEPHMDLSQVTFDDSISGNQELTSVTRFLVCATNNLGNI